MANLKKLILNDTLLSQVVNRLELYLTQPTQIAVALSGGVDSVVLLDLMARLRARFPFRLSAIHVNHQISQNAPHWTEFCAYLCQQYHIPLEIVTLNLQRTAGESLEAKAREARYATFAKLNVDMVVMAHHMDDQAETLLLQLLRGAGVKGLAGMPIIRPISPNSPLLLVRPLLDVTRHQINDYALQHQLQWIEDESNADCRYVRNFLRHQLLPLLESVFPQYRQNLYRSSQHLAEATLLLEEFAAKDSQDQLIDGALPLSLLNALPAARAKNVLRYFLDKRGVHPLPSSLKLQEMMRQLLTARIDSQIKIELGDLQLECFNGKAYLIKKWTTPDSPLSIHWQGQAEILVPAWHGKLCFRQERGKGFSSAALNQPFELLPRIGGERIQPTCQGKHRTLKNLLQEAGLAPWQRARLPLIFINQQLACVPGIAVDCHFQEKTNGVGWWVDWQFE